VFLFFHAEEVSAGGIHRHTQLSAGGGGAVDHVPGKFVGLAIPIEDVKDWRIGNFLQQLVSAMFLGGIQRLVGIDFEKGLVNTVVLVLEGL